MGEIINTPDNNENGYFLKVDLKYCDNIKEKTKNFPFCPENKKIHPDNFIEYMKMIKPTKYTKSKKLICDWADEKNYLIHYRLLKFYVRHGTVVVKIHEIISFKQSRWLKKYITFNTKKNETELKMILRNTNCRIGSIAQIWNHHSTAFFQVRKSLLCTKEANGKKRLLVNLRKINSPIADDCTNNNHPVSTLSDAAHHLAVKSLFCKPGCSQAYHCLQMADQRSGEMLAFNFASRTFAYKRLAQGLSRSVSAFSSFMREYLDPFVKAEQCAQYVDDIGIAGNNATDLTRNIRAVFKCIRQTGLKLTIEKCHFGVRQVELLGRTISPEGISLQARKIQDFLNKLRFPKSKKALQRYLGFVNYYRNYNSRMAEKNIPFYKLLKTEVPINITSDLKETFDSVNTALSNACELALKQPIPRKQLVLMTDASFRSAGYALMIEDNPDQKIQSKRKTYAPVAFGSKSFSPAQLKMSLYSKEILAIYMAFLEFSDILWEATKPTIVLTDNKSVTRSFQTKAIPPALWNACDYVLQFNFKVAHSAGSVNNAADFPSRLELKVTEKIRLKIREDIQTTPIEVTTSSSDVADEEQFSFTQADKNDESEEQTLERKERSRQNAKQWAANEESPVLKTKCERIHKVDGNSTSYSMNGIKAKARTRVEQDVDLVLKNMKLKILGQRYDEVILITDSRYRNYKENEDRISLKDGLLFRKII